jgi:hypothetical protein
VCKAPPEENLLSQFSLSPTLHCVKRQAAVKRKIIAGDFNTELCWIIAMRYINFSPSSYFFSCNSSTFLVSWKKTRRDFSGWIWDERLRGGKFFEENF